ncbi:glutaminyl-peptide cyclotransferase [Mycobacterium sp. PS03-16]|uniref:glutaminyl-peptide cyclotransferase n=1 Tax=Mycobacterium sp. PS03-16 TaxID=2559611 RepID=UPI0010742418|nr:glutaminyl-peptide cyclotransferase [Mycobacterium sp. PS03-16]TFV57343.1 glutaminyl-peptide cyclotransferase [Mycobacterium sp. PS03-16]
MSVMRSLRVLLVLCAIALLVIAGCAQAEDAAARPGPEERLRVTVLGEQTHDPTSFTQGLEVDGSALYETTGLVGRSQLRELDPATGQLRRSAPLPRDYFGEGMTVVENRIWQLTYRDGVAIEWDKATFTPRREVPVDGEGWGVCFDGARMIRSDGTNLLRFVDPADFTDTGAVPVTRSDGTPVNGLNELECADGQVWANVWPTDQIVRIDPGSGAVTASVDASVLRRGHPDVDVLNGIAAVGNGEFLVTGKNWPTIYRVRFDPAPDDLCGQGH